MTEKLRLLRVEADLLQHGQHHLGVALEAGVGRLGILNGPTIQCRWRINCYCARSRLGRQTESRPRRGDHYRTVTGVAIDQPGSTQHALVTQLVYVASVAFVNSRWSTRDVQRAEGCLATVVGRRSGGSSHRGVSDGDKNVHLTPRACRPVDSRSDSVRFLSCLQPFLAATGGRPLWWVATPHRPSDATCPVPLSVGVRGRPFALIDAGSLFPRAASLSMAVCANRQATRVLFSICPMPPLLLSLVAAADVAGRYPARPPRAYMCKASFRQHPEYIVKACFVPIRYASRNGFLLAAAGSFGRSSALF